MDVSKLYQLELLRGKISSIIGRGIAAVLLALIVKASHPLLVLVLYIIVSWVWIFVKATGNWLIGVAGALIAFFVFGDYISKQPENRANILAIVFTFGLVVYDAINIIKYVTLKGSLAKEGIEARRMSKQEMQNYKNNQAD
jgi:hypothetical protein